MAIDKAAFGSGFIQAGSEWSVDVERVARDLGIVIRWTWLDGPSGVLVREGKHSLVILNRRNHPVRQRFTLAHEIGHVFLGHPGLVFKCHMTYDNIPRGSNRLYEWQANRFAEQMLMPEELVKEFVANHGLHLNAIRTAFGVSEATAYWRLVHLGLVQERLAI
ncbi:MAG: ImmA/IrrE family metallo-endopeptidase [Bacillota bacterium]|nr:ImmA/IrrE family metallo-endopeptidase [Bacillota bacterium]